MPEITLLKEQEERWLARELANSISNLRYPVGMGVAPKDEHVRAAARILFERYAGMIDMARTEGARQLIMDAAERLPVVSAE